VKDDARGLARWLSELSLGARRLGLRKRNSNGLKSSVVWEGIEMLEDEVGRSKSEDEVGSEGLVGCDLDMLSDVSVGEN